MRPHLHHHGGVGHVCPPALRCGPAHQRIGLVVVDGEAAEAGEGLLDLPHGLQLLLEDGQGGPAPLQEAGKVGPRKPEPNPAASAHLLVQGDVVDPHARFSGEEVGSIVAVLQQRPAVRRVGGGVARVARTPQPQQAAGGTQALRAGVVVIQEAWTRRGENQQLRSEPPGPWAFSQSQSQNQEPEPRPRKVCFRRFFSFFHLELTC